MKRIWIFCMAFQLIFAAEGNYNVYEREDSSTPSKWFTSYELVTTNILLRGKRSTTDSIRQEDHIAMEITVANKSRILDLKLNKQLLAEKFNVWTDNGSGPESATTPWISDICHYNGVVLGAVGSWVAVSTCDGVRGSIYDGQTTYFLEPGPEPGLTFVYDSAHRKSNNLSCGLQSHEGLRRTREIHDVRGPFNMNSESRFVELVFVVDFALFNQEFQRNESLAYRHCRDIANIIHSVYAPLNIFIALIGVVIWTSGSEVKLSEDANYSLEQFRAYRTNVLNKLIANDNAQLLTKIKFRKNHGGMAYVGGMCEDNSVGVSTGSRRISGFWALFIAHEMGHNFGLRHDKEVSGCSCPDGGCIMAACYNWSWSTCSQLSLKNILRTKDLECLKNVPSKLFQSPNCGNGFLEKGEQCDCGLKKNCKNPCCNAETCTLKANAECATGDCCDLTTCKIVSAGQECRSTNHECDLPEFCTGKDEFCPIDFYKMNGEECREGQVTKGGMHSRLSNV